jgi:dipeptidyl-peptidase-3
MILCFGQEIVSRMLLMLHVWKCIGDVDSTRSFFEKYSQVDEKFLKARKIIKENTVPKRLELFHNLTLDDDQNVSIIEYPETMEGIINSFIDR